MLRVALLMVLSAPKETVQVKITLGVKSFFFFFLQHEGKAPFRGRFLSARTGSEVAFFPESHLQELLNSFPKLHLALGPGQLLQSHFPGSEDGKRALGFVPSTAAIPKAGDGCYLPATRCAAL